MIQYENVKYFIDTHEEPGTLMACYLVHIKVKSRKYQGVERKKERKKERQKSEYRVGVLVPPPINRNQRTRVDLAAFVSVERISVLCKPKHATAHPNDTLFNVIDILTYLGLCNIRFDVKRGITLKITHAYI